MQEKKTNKQLVHFPYNEFVLTGGVKKNVDELSKICLQLHPLCKFDTPAKNLSPQEFACRAEQSLETALRCVSKKNLIREKLNMPTDGEFITVGKHNERLVGNIT